MKIIIAGDGKVGETLAKQLSLEDNDVTLIDPDSQALELTMQRYDVMGVQGNCATVNTLKQAGINDADLLIAATSKDEINLLCCMTGYAVNPNIHTIARIRNPEYAQQSNLMKNAFGLSLSVNPERRAAIEIGRLLRYPGFLKRETFAKGRVEIVELRIDENSRLKNVQLKNLNNIVRCKVLVCTVVRGGRAITPNGNFILLEGDRIFVTAPSDILSLLLKNLGIIPHKVKNVMIAGGSRISYYLANYLLSSGMSVQIIEQDYDRCVELADLLPKATIINADASDQETLDSEGIDTADAIVTLTGMDELNMIISLYADSCNVPQVITKLGRTENSRMLDNLPIGSVISPKNICADIIVQYVRAMNNTAGAAVSVHSIADGQSEAIEFVVDENTLHCGEMLKDIKTKDGTLVVCITHNGVTEIPNGNSSYQVGDTIIVVTNSDTVLYQINDIFD